MQMDGSTRAAVFVLSLDEDRAVKILQHFDDAELQKLRDAALKLGHSAIDTETLERVYEEFATAFKAGLTSMRGGTGYLQDLVRKARGDEQATRLFALPAAEQAPEREPFAALASVDIDVLTGALDGEHPQIAAAILAHADPSTAAAVLGRLGNSQRSDLLRRIATLAKIPRAAFADAERGLGSLEVLSAECGEVDGVRSAASILNELPESAATELLERLGETHPDEANRLRRAMLTFEHLVEADKRGLQQMLREVPSETLMVALKTASEPLKERLLGCMSTRASTMLLEELALMGPVRVSEVEAAQQQIVELALRLVGEGKLTIAGRGETMV